MKCVLFLWISLASGVSQWALAGEAMVLHQDSDRRLTYQVVPGTGENTGLDVSKFTLSLVDSGKSQEVITSAIDPFRANTTPIAVVGPSTALVVGQTDACHIVGEFGLNPLSVIKIFPCIDPVVSPDKSKVSFLSWQDRSIFNAQTAVVNVWSIDDAIHRVVVFPPSNAISESPQPWTEKIQKRLSLVSPMVWSPDGNTLAFVSRVGFEFNYTMVFVRMDKANKPRFVISDLPLAKILHLEPKYYIDRFFILVNKIDFTEKAVRLSFKPAAFLKEMSFDIDIPRDDQYVTPRAALDKTDMQSDPQRVIRFSKNVIDLGVLAPKLHRFEFEFRNNSKEKAHLLSTFKSCVCLTIDEYDSIIPGNYTGKLSGYLDMSEIEDSISATMTILAASKENVQATVLTVRGRRDKPPVKRQN